MNALEWLATKAPGVGQLSPEEKQEILEFSLLWGFFEFRLLRANASGPEVSRLCSWLSEQGRINAAALAEPIAYWRNRYYSAGNITYHFDHLRFREASRSRDPDNIEIVRAVLMGEDDSPERHLACALSIVRRYRNNLFHGEKWSYELQGQLKNFQMANAVLMATMDMARVEDEA